jgi:hypothetical protein
MPLDQQSAKTFSRLKIRLANLEKASEAREEAIKQLAERLGVEVDLTRMPTAIEEYEIEMAKMRSGHLLDYLKESEQDGA